MLFPEYRPKERSAVPKEQSRHQVQKSAYRLYDVLRLGQSKGTSVRPQKTCILFSKSHDGFCLWLCVSYKAANVTRSVA